MNKIKLTFSIESDLTVSEGDLDLISESLGKQLESYLLLLGAAETNIDFNHD